MNILITSVGRRGYLVKYFKEALANTGKIFAADCNVYTPGLYNADDFFIIPKHTSDNYIKELCSVCEKNAITGIISVNDLELPLFALHRDLFFKKGIHIITPSVDVVDTCFDKYKAFQFLQKHGLPTPFTYNTLSSATDALNSKELDFPLMVKPNKGSASFGLRKVNSLKELQFCFREGKDIIQEFLTGKEYGIDIFSNAKNKPVSIFAKQKLVMRAGETDKSLSHYDTVLLDLMKKLAMNLKLYGPTDVDVFKCGDGYKIMEINPRFGGGYPASHALGASFPEKILSLKKGEEVSEDFMPYPNGLLMMKQYEIVIKKNLIP